MSNTILLRVLVIGIVGFGVIIWILPSVAKADLQIAQIAAEREAQRSVDNDDFDAQRERDNEKQEAHDARAKAQNDLSLQREDIERDQRAADAKHHRTQRKARLKALIEK